MDQGQWIEGRRGRYRLGGLLLAEEGLQVYLCDETRFEGKGPVTATFVALREFDPRFKDPGGPILRSGLPPELPPDMEYALVHKLSSVSRQRRLRVCQALLPHRTPLVDPHGQVKALVDSLPREVVGPKSRRRFWQSETGVLPLRYENGLQVGVCFAVYYVDLKPKRLFRKGNFPLPVKRALLEAAGYRCQRCGSTERLEVDHVDPLWAGGKATFENGRVLCHQCHVQKSKGEGSFGFTPW